MQDEVTSLVLPPSLRGKRFRLVLEQRKTEERDFRVWSSETLHFFPTPSPLFYSHHFFCRSSFFAPKPQGNAWYAG